MSDNRTRIWFSLFVLAVFCVGLALGMLIGRRMAPPPRPGPIFERLMSGPGRGGPPPERLLDRLQSRLGLTPEQRTRVEAIFGERRGRLERLQDEIRTRTDAEQRELREEMNKVLTLPQQERFAIWLDETAGGRRGRGPGRSGPFGPPGQR